MTTDILTTPLRDVLDLPERVTASDYVLNLQSGVAHAEPTLHQYVVTDGIAGAMDEALDLVATAMRAQRSSGAFVHGLFGSGKSHFMAVLHLLLAGNPHARALGGLQRTVADHEELLGKSFLALDYHLLGKESLEAAIFEGYLTVVRERHPDVAPPLLHRSEDLLADARTQRAQYGDDAFFAALNSVGSDDDGPTGLAGLGDLGRLTPGAGGGSGWTADRFERALVEPVGGPERTRLSQQLIRTLFTGYVSTGTWVDISTGLRTMTEHARGLGYDAVVLFLDELVLWLAQHLSDTTFIQRETSKVAKLVETEMGTLPLPMISFVARQRDLKDFLGNTADGAEQVAIGQSFQWWEDRFDRIELKAADLPKIVHQRLLQPRDDDGARAIAAAVDRIRHDRQAMTHLLTDEAASTEADFALVYPFSPALVDAMIALSALMQRERTALKIMGELLAEGRDHLRVGDLIGVGELFDAVVLSPAKPLTPDMRRRFAVAEHFYANRLRPYLLEKYDVTETEAAALPRNAPFRTEDRLAKTLLVSYIAPGTASLTNLTAAKLAALNYGTVTSLIPGREASQVTQWAREWAQKFGDVVVGTEANPVIGLQLSGVDYETVIERVQAEDSPSNRRQLIRELLAEELGLGPAEGFRPERPFTHVWRGSRREVDVLFANVRETKSLPADQLRAEGGRWRVVVDYPFDEPGHFPSDDFARLNQERDAGLETNTVVWLPHFLTAARMQDVGRLVLLEHLHKPRMFEANASHLAPAEQEPARLALENQRKALREQLVRALREAYGIAAPRPEDVDTGSIAANEIFTALRPGLTVRTPAATTMRDGLAQVMDQALGDQFPDHPRFEPEGEEVRRAEVRNVLTLVRQALAERGRLAGLDRTKARLLQRVAGPLGVGTPRENVYALSATDFRWHGEFTRAVADTGRDGDVTVSDLRDRLAPTGMATDLQDLLVIAWAALTDREIVQYGTVLREPAIGELKPHMALRQPPLPDAAVWEAAHRRAQQLFGAQPEAHLSAAALHRVAGTVRTRAEQLRAGAEQLERALREHQGVLGLSGDSARMVTAVRARELVTALRRGDDLALVTALTEADVPEEPQALGKSLSTAGDVIRGLGRVPWDVLRSVEALPGGAEVMAAVRATAERDELHAPLVPVLDEATARANRILIEATRVTPTGGGAGGGGAVGGGGAGGSGETIEPPTSGGGGVTVTEVDKVYLDADGAEASVNDTAERLARFVRDNPGRRVHVKWWVE
ncbi:hypothetical protein [Georgenia subflava]|uniref:Phage resistance protein n=1 Tax=Georgenia subflava TaxID=1622177 RepID=A0A6N7EG72_9MICO|nr:hypothetical protein [Georgenia subflava]MPV35655.1 hypothetical protein [Georgenia subflava]